MVSVYLYDRDKKVSTSFISFLEKGAIFPISVTAFSECLEADSGDCLCIFVRDSTAVEEILHEVASLNKDVGLLFICSYEPDRLFAVPQKFPFYDILIPPLSDEDILIALHRLQKHLRQNTELDNLHVEIESKQKMISVYHELTKTLSATLNFKQVLRKVREKSFNLLPCMAFSLYLFNEERGLLEFVPISKNDEIIPTNRVYRTGEGIPGVVYEKERFLLLNHPFEPQIKKLLSNHYPVEIEGLCCIPLEFKDRILGVMEAVNKKDGQKFDDSDRVVLQILADNAAIAIENSRLYQKVEKLTIVDDLTQLYNYRYFNMVLVREFRRAERFLSPLSLLFLDLDGFKNVNDVYGHMIGSLVLKDIAKVIKSTVRIIDIVARFGGDEFTVILPSTGFDGAELVAQRIWRKIESYRFPDPKISIQVSVSIGISSFPEHVQTVDQLLKVADKAMYTIKENRKNDMKIGTLSHDDVLKLSTLDNGDFSDEKP